MKSIRNGLWHRLAAIVLVMAMLLSLVPAAIAEEPPVENPPADNPPEENLTSTIAFSPGHGTFTCTSGHTVIENTLTVNQGETVSFSYTPGNGYEAVVLGNDVPMAPVDDIYTLAGITEDYTITVEETDVQEPTLADIVVSGDNATWSTSKQISFLATDNSGEVNVYVTTTEISELAELDALEVVSSPYTVTDSIGVDAVTYYIYAKDAANKVATSSVEVAMVDAEAPEISDITTTAAETATVKEYTFTVTETGSGIISVECNDSKGNAVSCTDDGNGNYKFDATANGDYTVTVTDIAGNTKTASTRVEGVDNTAPVIDNVIVPETWNINNTITFTVGDNVSQEPSVYHSNQSYTSEQFENAINTADVVKVERFNGQYEITVDKNGTYYLYALDDLKNFTTKGITVAYVDETAPIIEEITKSSVTNEAGWINENVTVTITVKDAQLTSDNAGEYKVQYCKVVAGDSVTDPDFNAAQSGEVRYKENGVGMFSFVVGEDCNDTYYIRVLDQYNRTSQISTSEIKLDKTEPVVEVKTVTQANPFIARVANVLSFNTVFRDTITLAVTATDAGSGIAAYEYKLADGEWQTYTTEAGTVVDNVLTMAIPIPDEYQNTGFSGTISVRVSDIAGNKTEREPSPDMTGVELNVAVDNYVVDANGENWINLNEEKPVTVTACLSGADSDNLPTGVALYGYEYRRVMGETDSGWTLMEGVNHDTLVINSAQYEGDAVYYFRAVLNLKNVYVESSGMRIMFDMTAPQVPVVTLDINADAGNDDPNGKDGWYQDTPEIVIDAAEVQKAGAPETTYYKLWMTDDSEPVWTELTTNPEISEDGVWNLKVRTVDDAGNKSDVVSSVIKVDTKAPQISEIQISGNYQNDDNEPFDRTETGSFKESILRANLDTYSVDRYWRANSATITMDAEWEVSGTDRTADAEEYHSVQYYKARVSDVPVTDKNGEVVLDDENKPIMTELSASEYAKYLMDSLNSGVDPIADKWQNYSAAGLSISAGERIFVIFRMEDAAGNVSYACSTGFVVDDGDPGSLDVDVFSPDIGIDVPNAGEDGYYVESDADSKGNITAKISVADPQQNADDPTSYSGLKSVTYTVTSSMENDDGSFAVGQGNYDALAQEVTGDIAINLQQFNSNDVVITVTAVDNAGNVTVDSKTIQIDITKPVVDIRYNNNTASNSKYFNADRTATITVTERNFSTTDANAFVYRVTNTDRVTPSISAWKMVNHGSGNGDDRSYQATITYHADGDYTFDVTNCLDLAGNSFTTESYAAGTVMPTAFTIDQTAPVVTVTYDNNNAANGKYFNASRTATVTVVEHNFTADQVNFEITGGGYVSGWSRNGDNNVCTISYNEDADYTFDMNMSDLAANSNEVVSYGGSTAPQDFTVDMTVTAPTIVETASTAATIDMTTESLAYAKEFVPSVAMEDTNYDAALSRVTLTRTVLDTRDADVSELVAAYDQSETATGGAAAFTTFEEIRENDGIYTLTATITDMAGNTEESVAVFTVNRFGSIYVYSEDLTALIAEGGQYVQGVEEQYIAVTEYNPTQLKNETLFVDITRDGSALDTVQMDVTEARELEGVGWYTYEYHIASGNFAQEGLYKMSLTSTDAAENHNESGLDNIWQEATKAYVDDTIRFWVDKTKPELANVVGMEEAYVNDTEKQITYTLYDAIGLASVEVDVMQKDGQWQTVQEVAQFEDVNNFDGTFTLQAGTDQKVRFVITDLAGYVTDTNDESYLAEYENRFSEYYTFVPVIHISDSMFALWYANTLLFWVSIAGIVLVTLIVAVLWVSRRKKDEAEV